MNLNVESTDTLYVGMTGRLKHIWIELTEKCNLECLHCYAGSSPAGESYLDIEYLTLALEEAKELGADSVQFTGGEPMIRHKELEKLIWYALDLGFENVMIYSNLTFLPENILELFGKLGRRRNGYGTLMVKTTFFSYNPKLHDFLVRRKGAFYKQVENVKKILAQGIDVFTGVPLCELNSDKKHIRKTKKFLYELGIKDVSFDFVRPQGRAKSNFSFRDESMCQIWRSCLSLGKLCLSYDGRIYPCIFLRDNLIGIFPEISLADAFEKLKELISCGVQVKGKIVRKNGKRSRIWKENKARQRKTQHKNASVKLPSELVGCGEFFERTTGGELI